MKANITRGNVYTNTNTLSRFQINHQQQAWGKGIYENAHIKTVAIQFSRRQERETSTLRTFCRLKASVYREARQSGNESVII